MDLLTQLASPVVLIFVLSTIGGLIVKAVRLQGKVDDQAGDIKFLTETAAEQKALVETHRSNQDIHFNLRISQEVDKRNELRFGTIEKQMREINGKLDRVLDKQ